MGSAAQMMLPALLAKLQQAKQGGQPGMSSPPGGGAPAGAPDAIGQAVSAQYSELQNVDPGKMVADLRKMKETVAALFPVAVTRVADAAKGISQAVTGLNAAIKAFEKAQQVMQTSGPALGISAAQTNPQPPGPPMMGQPPGAM